MTDRRQHDWSTGKVCFSTSPIDDAESFEFKVGYYSIYEIACTRRLRFLSGFSPSSLQIRITAPRMEQKHRRLFAQVAFCCVRCDRWRMNWHTFNRTGCTVLRSRVLLLVSKPFRGLQCGRCRCRRPHSLPSLTTRLVSRHHFRFKAVLIDFCETKKENVSVISRGQASGWKRAHVWIILVSLQSN